MAPGIGPPSATTRATIPQLPCATHPVQIGCGRHEQLRGSHTQSERKLCGCSVAGAFEAVVAVVQVGQREQR